MSACSTLRTPVTPGEGSVRIPSSESVTDTPVTVSNVLSTAPSGPGGMSKVRGCGCGGVWRGPRAFSCQ